MDIPLFCGLRSQPTTAIIKVNTFKSKLYTNQVSQFCLIIHCLRICFLNIIQSGTATNFIPILQQQRIIQITNFYCSLYIVQQNLCITHVRQFTLYTFFRTGLKLLHRKFSHIIPCRKMIMRGIRTIIAILVHFQINSFCSFLRNKPGHTSIHYRHIKTRLTTYIHIISLSFFTFTRICKLGKPIFHVSGIRINNRCSTVFIKVSCNRKASGSRHGIRVYNFLSRIVSSSPTTITIGSKTLIHPTVIFQKRKNHFCILRCSKYRFIRCIRIYLAFISPLFIQNLNKFISILFYKVISCLTSFLPFFGVRCCRK